MRLLIVWCWRRKGDLLSQQSLWPWRILHPGAKRHSALAHPGTPSVTQKCHQPSCELDTEALPWFQNGLRTTALLSSALEDVALADRAWFDCSMTSIPIHPQCFKVSPATSTYKIRVLCRMAVVIFLYPFTNPFSLLSLRPWQWG